MVTKVAEPLSLPLSQMFYPKGIDNGTVSYAGGILHGEGATKTVPAGTVAVPGYPYKVYIDTATGTIKAATEATNLTNAVVLYRGTGPTDLQDLRSWTMHDGDITNILPTFNSTLESFAPTHLWIMDENNGTNETQVTDTGSDPLHLSANDLGGLGLVQLRGWTKNEYANLVGNTNGGGDLEFPSMPSHFNNDTTGTLIGMFRMNSRSLTSNTRELFDLQGATSNNFTVSIRGTTQDLQVRLDDGTGVETYTHGVSLNDGGWHWYAVIQDGVDLKVYLDGSDITSAMTQTASGGGLANSTWFSGLGPFAASSSHIGGSNISESNCMLGPHAYYSGKALSAADITKLQDTLTGKGYWEKLVDLAPHNLFFFDEFQRGSGVVPVWNVGSTGGSNFTLSWQTAPTVQQEVEVFGFRSDFAAYNITSLDKQPESPSNGPTTGITSAGYGSVAMAFLYGSGGDTENIGYLWDCYDGNHQVSLRTRRRAASGNNGQDVFLEYYTHDSTAGAAYEYTAEYGNTPINDGQYHVVYIIKNNDTNVPDVYIDNVLQTATATSSNANQDPDHWFDDLTTNRFTMGGRNVITGFTQYNMGYQPVYWFYKDGYILSADDRATIYSQFRNDEVGSSFLSQWKLHPPHLFTCQNSAGASNFDRGFFGRYGGDTSQGQDFENLSKVVGTTTRVTGPATGLFAMDGGANDKRYDDGFWLDFGDNNTQGCVICHFKCSEVTPTGRIWAYGQSNNSGNETDVLWDNADSTGDIRFWLRGTNDYDITIRRGGGLNDGNWHMFAWRCDGSTWEIFIDDTWYDINSAEWHENTSSGGANNGVWWDEMSVTSGFHALKGRASVATGGMVGSAGPVAIWQDYDLPSNTAIERWAQTIGTMAA